MGYHGDDGCCFGFTVFQRCRRESWQTGWKGKVVQAIQMIQDEHPGTPIILIAVAGGPACEWEREVLLSGKLKQHCPNARLKFCSVLPELESFLSRGAPLEE